jgi:hypothetical protein
MSIGDKLVAAAIQRSLERPPIYKRPGSKERHDSVAAQKKAFCGLAVHVICPSFLSEQLSIDSSSHMHDAYS